MATQKVSVTLDESTIERARRRVGPRGLSAYLRSALEEKLQRDETPEDRRQALIQWLEELDAADPPTEEEKKRAEADVARLIAAIEG